MNKIISPFELDETFFQRNQFYGWDFSWYAVDSVGEIAKFTSGHLPIPEKIFSSKSEYEKVDRFFDNLPIICKSRLSPAYERIKNHSLNGFATILEESRRGIFTFEEPSDFKDYYHLCAIPEIRLKLEEPPKEIQNYINFFKIDSIKFCETEQINILDFFECDLTR